MSERAKTGEYVPPPTIFVRFCPKCGRDGRDQPLSSFHGGRNERLCPGKVENIRYDLSENPNE